MGQGSSTHRIPARANISLRDIYSRLLIAVKLSGIEFDKAHTHTQKKKEEIYSKVLAFYSIYRSLFKTLHILLHCIKESDEEKKELFFCFYYIHQTTVYLRGRKSQSPNKKKNFLSFFLLCWLLLAGSD